MPKFVYKRLEKVFSTKLAEKEYNLLTLFARDLYIKEVIDLPTISRLARFIISRWINEKMLEDSDT